MTSENRAEVRETRGLVEVRASGDDKRTIGGYAAKFGKLSQNLGGFVERIDTRAFNRAKGDEWPNVVARYNHSDEYLLGRSSNRSLRLSTDEDGLVYEVDLLPHRFDVYSMVQRGDITQSSFAFRVIGDEGEEWGLTDQSYPVRTLLDVALMDVAPVNAPAYLDTSTAIRSLARQVHADVEEVRKLAAENELRKFFKRTDGSSAAKPKTDFGAAARMALLGRKTDPWL